MPGSAYDVASRPEVRGMSQSETLLERIESTLNTALLQLSIHRMSDECEARVSKAKAETRAVRSEIKARDEERQKAILRARRTGVSKEITRSMYPKLTDAELQRAFQE